MKKSKLPKQALIILSIALVLVISTVMWSSAQITQDTEEEVQSTYYTALPMRSAFPRMQSMQNPLLHSWDLLSPPMSLNGSVSSHRTVR